MPIFHENIFQGSAEWLAFRKGKITATGIATIMGINPYKSPFMLFQEELGLREPEPENDAMRRGKALEPLALQKYHDVKPFYNMVPSVVTHSDYPNFMASLDGFDEKNCRGVEIKCMGARNHAKAKDSIDPVHYMQMQWQMFCTGCNEWDYYCFDGEDGFNQTVLRDPIMIEKMIVKANEFLEMIRTVTPPAYTDLDYDDKTDDEHWNSLMTSYALYDRMEKDGKIGKEHVKQLLIEHANGRNVIGCNSKFTSYKMKGAVDYSAIPELKNVNIDMYRKPDVNCFKITLNKD